MAATTSAYDYIVSKIHAMKETYPSLRGKSDDYVFSALCIKAHFYKNPALILYENEYEDMIVDGQRDGGVDILLSDPSAEGADLVIGQSKFYQTISSEDVLNAVLKMASFYKDMVDGHYEQVNPKVQRRFLSLYSEVGEESKIHFVLYTSAPQNRIRRETIKKKFKEQFSSSDAFTLSILFAPEIEEQIKESESRRPSVETGKIKMDQAGNYLLYGENAAIVNVSAYSIKQLYAQHNTNLLARNLRYHIKGGQIDKDITQTIKDYPQSLWMKNNGITIVCDAFEIDGTEVKLRNFSIVNGGQTTYLLHKSPHINSQNDLYLVCKIVKTIGASEDEKTAFSLEIACATNAQKAIKPADLKANAPEQVRFAREMREVGIWYKTKRGEEVPSQYKVPYLNTDLAEVGKLCLSALFQLPCTSRSKPSSLYQDRYYRPIFHGNQTQIATLCKELLYIDHYFRKVFQRQFDKDNQNEPNANTRIAFANNARTICIAFVAFAARYQHGNLTHQALNTILSITPSTSNINTLYDIFQNFDRLPCFLPFFHDKDRYDAALSQLFKAIIDTGITSFSIANQYDPTLTATNFLKNDTNYYNILRTHWTSLKVEIDKVF